MISVSSFLTSVFFLAFGVWKLVSSPILITLLVASEMIISGMLFVLIHKWQGMMFMQCIVAIIVIAVIEGVVGLLIFTNMFRESSIYSSYALMF